MKASTGIVLAVAVIAGGTFGWREFGHKDQKPAPPPAVPVTAATAKTAELPVYLRGIGTVRALNAVEIHPQVGGVLLRCRSRKATRSRRARCWP